MTTMDVFAGDGFSTRELSDAINVIPNQWGRIGELGIFVPKPLREPKFEIERKNGHLQLVGSTPRGSAASAQDRGKRDLRPFKTSRFALESRITADDIDGIRAFGSETELMQVQDEIVDRQIELRGSMDITREWLRATALQGLIKDADGSTILDLHDAFDVTRTSFDFTFGATTSIVATQLRALKDHIRVSLLGDVMTKARLLCSSTFFEGLMNDEGFERAHDFQAGLNPLRNDMSEGVEYQGWTIEKYIGEAGVPQEDGTTVIRQFVPDGEALVVLEGTRTTYRQYNAPADYMETVNTPGLDFYSKIMPDPKANRYVDVEAQMNTLPMLMRPALAPRVFSSN